MADLVDRDALMCAMNALYQHHIEMCNFSADGAVADCINILSEAPTVDAVEVKHGHWIYDGCYEMGGLPKCSSCGRRSHSGAYGDEDGYCPHCGAKMDEVVKK